MTRKSAALLNSSRRILRARWAKSPQTLLMRRIATFLADYDHLCREKRHAMPSSGVVVGASESLRKFLPRFSNEDEHFAF
jgi:hypothetical protein